MTRVRIICLAPPRNWVKIKENNNVTQNLLEINRNSKSWASTNGIKGTRYGIYRQPYILEDKKFVTIPFLWDKISDTYNTNLESLIDPDYKNKVTSDPQSIFIESEIIFDIEEGICYAVDSGIYQTPFEKLNEFLKKVVTDTKIQISDFRQFSWDRNILNELEHFAKNDNFTSYVERGRTHHHSRLTGKGGDLDQDNEFQVIKRDYSDGKWTTYTYLHNDLDDKWRFSLRGNTISISNNDENKDRHVLMARVLRVRSLFEKTINGQTVPQYCFSDYR